MRRSFFVFVIAGGCASYAVTGGPTRNDGEVRVSGAKGGFGAGLELGGARAAGAGEVGAYLTADFNGYLDDGDGDPITWIGASARYRRYLAVPTRVAPFVALGGGAGYSANQLVVEGIAELGVRVPLGAGLGFTIGLRDRPAGFVGTGDPAVAPNNTLQLAIGLDWRRSPPRPAAPAGADRVAVTGE